MWDRNNYAAPFSINGSPRPGSAAAGATGWGGDPSRIIELTKAYAYAQENGLPLPSGLIAHRPAGGSQNSQMVGSFQYTNQTALGKNPALLVVMSVEDQQTAEIVISSKGRYNPKTDKMEAGALWRYLTARVSGNHLDFVPRDGAYHMTFDWRDANSGSFSTLNEQQVGGNRNLAASERFTRLDG